MKRIILIAMVMLATLSCRNTKQLLPNVSGKAGEVIVVIDRADWEGALGNEVRGLLAADCSYLAQMEPLYSLVNVAPGGFADLFKVHRNIVMVAVSPQLDSAAVHFRRDVWAAPQCVVQIAAHDSDEACALLKTEGQRIVAAIEQAERDRVIANCIRYENRPIAAEVSELFGGSPHFPTGYKLKKKTSDFVWVEDEKQYTTQGVLIYRYPALDNEPFTEKSLVMHRNEILKENVPGMFENTWMTTSDAFPRQVEYVRFRGRDFAQLRGMWEVENDYMGGPFVSHAFYSQDGTEIIVAEAFVYAPKYDKRQYLRQVESIVYSWEWNKGSEKE